MLEDIFSPDKVYITVAIAGTLGLLIVSILIGITIRRRQRQVLNHCRFRPRRRLMDGPERRCFQLLIELFGHHFYVIPSVEVSALLNHKVGTQDRQAAYGFIENKTVDFVLCNKHTVRPICAIKLGPEPHVKKTPGSSPEDLSRFFRSAHIPFVYLPRAHDISSETIIEEFSRVVYETSIPKRMTRRK